MQQTPQIRGCEPQQSTYMFWSPPQSHIWEPLFPFCSLFLFPPTLQLLEAWLFELRSDSEHHGSSWTSFSYVRAAEILSDLLWAPTSSPEGWSAATPAGSTLRTDISLPRLVVAHRSTEAQQAVQTGKLVWNTSLGFLHLTWSGKWLCHLTRQICSLCVLGKWD